ncbi:MAG: RNA-guided pseudouridylation complex pseudouridine synthase subunit Cbf5 [Thermoplasmata archaeon]
MIVLSEAETDPRWGKSPSLRTMEERLRYGLVIVDKPQGPTSHQVTAWVKQIFGLSKAGHAGTLDPKVSGVLPVALDKATKALPCLLLGTKEYIALMRLHGDAEEKRIKEVFGKFIGDIYQLPPVRAAVKRELRVRRIHALNLLEISGRFVLFRVVCDSGTYVRTLCTDIGEVLGTGAQMQELRRVRTANFTESQAVKLQDLKDAWEFYKEGVDAPLNRCLLPMEAMLEHLPKVILKDSAVDAVCHGAGINVPGIAQLSENIARGDVVGVFTLKGEAVCYAEAKLSSAEILEAKNGLAFHPLRVLMPRGIYPRMWKRREGGGNTYM